MPVITAIIIAVVSIFVGNQITSHVSIPVQSGLSPTPINVARGNTPRLYTWKDQLRRADTDEPVQLKGVTSDYFRYDYLPDYHNHGVQPLIDKLQQAKKWGANSVQLYLFKNPTLQHIQDLDTVINWAKKNNMYVFLNPDVKPDDRTTPVGKFHGSFNNEINGGGLKDFQTTLAQRYKDKPNVIYGLWAEPKNIDSEKWYSKAKELNSNIKSIVPMAVTIMSGTNWGRDLRTIQDKGSIGPNVIYDFHDWPGDGPPNNLVNNKPGIYKDFIGKYPVMVGEFGGNSRGGFGTPQDVEFIKQVLNDVNQFKLHSFAYTIDRGLYDPDSPLGSPNDPLRNSFGTPNGPSPKVKLGDIGLFDYNTNQLTPKGQLFQQDFQQYPPTQF